MGYDPAHLRSMLSAPPPAFGGAQPNHGAAHGGAAGAPGAAPHQQQEAPQAEPVALHDAAVKAQEACAAARAALEELSAQAEMAETIDPSVEKAIATCSDSMGECDDGMQEVVANLLTAREDHEAATAVDDGAGDDAPPKK